MTFGSTTIEDDIIVPSAAEEHLVPGITIDFYLTFYSHLKQLCKKVANKLNALTRIAPYLRHNQTRLIYSLFREEISACAAVHTRCHGRVRSCATRNSFASYDGNIIRACRANKADRQ